MEGLSQVVSPISFERKRISSLVSEHLREGQCPPFQPPLFTRAKVIEIIHVGCVSNRADASLRGYFPEPREQIFLADVASLRRVCEELRKAGGF